MDDELDVIAAFVDGDPVDPARLTEALAVASGRDYLIDLLVLRALVGGPSSSRLMVATTATNPTSPSLWRRWIPAAAVFVALVTGYIVGTRIEARRMSRPAVVTAVDAAPQPTEVIRLRSGVDWSETAGGQ